MLASPRCDPHAGDLLAEARRRTNPDGPAPAARAEAARALGVLGDAASLDAFSADANPTIQSAVTRARGSG